MEPSANGISGVGAAANALKSGTMRSWDDGEEEEGPGEGRVGAGPA